jgi:putative phosphoesterase
MLIVETIARIHDLKTLAIDPAARGVDVIVSGHSHQVRVETIDGVLYLNPGSAGHGASNFRSRLQRWI